MGFALDRGSYVALYATEDAVFTITGKDGASEAVNVTGGELTSHNL